MILLSLYHLRLRCLKDLYSGKKMFCMQAALFFSNEIPGGRKTARESNETRHLFVALLRKMYDYKTNMFLQKLTTLLRN